MALVALKNFTSRTYTHDELRPYIKAGVGITVATLLAIGILAYIAHIYIIRIDSSRYSYKEVLKFSDIILDLLSATSVCSVVAPISIMVTALFAKNFYVKKAQHDKAENVMECNKIRSSVGVFIGVAIVAAAIFALIALIPIYRKQCAEADFWNTLKPWFTEIALKFTRAAHIYIGLITCAVLFIPCGLGVIGYHVKKINRQLRFESDQRKIDQKKL